MLEKIGDNDIIVRNYTDNFNIKEYIQQEMIPSAFPNIPMNKLNLGFTGIVSEYISQGIEDAQSTAALMMNESFISKAVMPSSIYANAAVFGLGYRFAKPSTCSFAVQLSLSDIIKNAKPVIGTTISRYILDKDTQIILGDSIYVFDYDVYIDFTMINRKRVFNIYYNMEETNSISDITSSYIKHQVTTIDWLVLFVDLKEYMRKTDTVSITDNTITTNSDIQLKWTRQIAGIDVVYITPQKQRLSLKLKTQDTKPDVEPFAWYKFIDDDIISLSFTSNTGYWNPEFNSSIEYTIYTCTGASANFTSYDRRTGVPIKKTGERYPYNSDTKMVAICYSGSTGGEDRGTIEDLRDDVLLAYNTVNVLTTDHDIESWFETYGKRHNTIAKFFKRRDDPSGRLFSQFISIVNDTYIYPTNTLGIRVPLPKKSDSNQSNSNGYFDAITYSGGNVSEVSIKPGHLWTYYEDEDKDIYSRDTLVMVTDDSDTPVIVTDDLTDIIKNNKFYFVNPFYIKIHKNPTTMISYNYLINHTSWPEDEFINTNTFYRFQLAQFSIERTLSGKYDDKYHIETICVPAVNIDSKYIEDDSINDVDRMKNNNMRVVLILRSNNQDTGYIEMVPTEIRSSGNSFAYAIDIKTNDHLNSDMTLEVDMGNTPGIKSLITSGSKAGKVFIDARETSFHIAVLMKDSTKPQTSKMFNDESFNGYVLANKFRNSHRELTLYSPMNMMRSYIKFGDEDKSVQTDTTSEPSTTDNTIDNTNDTGNTNADTATEEPTTDDTGTTEESQEDKEPKNVEVSLLPFLKYDIALDDDKMAYFIQAFDDQYNAMKPILSRLDGNSFLDIKFYNTYGKSANYYIGPDDEHSSLKDSELQLDNVYVKVKLVISVYDRSLYSQTVSDIKNEIIKMFDTLNQNGLTDIHVSEIIHTIRTNNPNVRYIRFMGFNSYDALRQSIFVKYSDISELNADKLKLYVPEMIRADEDSIEITEET